MQQVINNYGFEVVFNNAEVKKYFCNVIRNIEPEILDLTQFVDYRYSDGDTSFTFNKTAFHTDFRESNPNDPRSNIVPYDFDIFKLAPKDFSSKQSLHRKMRNTFKFIDMMSDLLHQNKRSRLLKFNELIYAKPIQNALGLNNTVNIKKDSGNATVALYSEMYTKLIKQSVDSSNINTFMDPDTLHFLRRDKEFSSYDFNSQGGLETGFKTYNFLGTNIIPIAPHDTTFGNNSLKYSMQNITGADPGKAYAIMFNKYAIGAVESNMQFEFESSGVKDERDYFALYSEINAGIVFSKGIYVLETKGLS